MTQCLETTELAEFVKGKIPEPRAEEISTHIDQCETCQDSVIELSGSEDTFVGALRSVQNEVPVEKENAFRHGLQRLLAGMKRDPVEGGDESLPTQIGPYVVDAKLGSGGMGTVFRATHSKLKRTVALKVLPAHRWSNAAAIARFEREMEAIGQLDHPHIVRASDAGEDNGMHYLVMEYVDGLDLARLGNRLGPIPVADACELARQAAIGLQHAHDAGLVHRDVKPSNLMLAWEKSDGLTSDTRPRLKLLDLGLALLGDEHLREEHDVTTVGALMGTLDYMSPEQGIDSHAVDHRADIYGLGATLFKLLTGRAPYADPQFSSLMKKMTALATKPAPSVGTIRPDLPTNVVQTVDRMLARDPDERFSSAREVAEALAQPAKDANLSSLLQRGIATEESSGDSPTASLARLHSAVSARQAKNAQAKTDGAGNRVWRWLIALAAGFLFAAAGMVWHIATDYGTIVVESEDAGAKLLIKKVQTGETVESIQLEQGKGEAKVRTGDYLIEIEGDQNKVTIEPPEGTVSRKGKLEVTVSHRSSGAERRFEKLVEALERHFPNDQVTPSMLNSSLVLTGEVESPNRLEEVVTVAKDFYPKVINNLRVQVANGVAASSPIIEMKIDAPKKFERSDQENGYVIRATIRNVSKETLSNGRISFFADNNLVPNIQMCSPGVADGFESLIWTLTKIPPGYRKTVEAYVNVPTNAPLTDTLSYFQFSSDQGEEEQFVPAPIVDAGSEQTAKELATSSEFVVPERVNAAKAVVDKALKRQADLQEMLGMRRPEDSNQLSDAVSTQAWQQVQKEVANAAAKYRDALLGDDEQDSIIGLKTEIVGPDRITAGEVATYIVRFTNRGNQVIANVASRLRATSESCLLFVPAETLGVGETPNGLTWNLGIGPGQMKSFKVLCQPQAVEGQHALVVEHSKGEAQSRAVHLVRFVDADSDADETIGGQLPQPGPAIEIMAIWNEAIERNTSTSIEATIVNNGTKVLTAGSLEFVADDRLTVYPDDSPGASYDGKHRLSWNIPPIAPGARRKVIAHVGAAADAPLVTTTSQLRFKSPQGKAAADIVGPIFDKRQNSVVSASTGASESQRLETVVQGPKALKPGTTQIYYITYRNTSDVILTDIRGTISVAPGTPDIGIPEVYGGALKVSVDGNGFYKWSEDEVPPGFSRTIEVKLNSSTDPSASKGRLVARVTANEGASVTSFDVELRGPYSSPEKFERARNWRSLGNEPPKARVERSLDHNDIRLLTRVPDGIEGGKCNVTFELDNRTNHAINLDLHVTGWSSGIRPLSVRRRGQFPSPGKGVRQQVTLPPGMSRVPLEFQALKPGFQQFRIEVANGAGKIHSRGTTVFVHPKDREKLEQGGLVFRAHKLEIPDTQHKALIDQITDTIAPESWRLAEGAGQIRKVTGGIIVSATPDVQEQVSTFLRDYKDRDRSSRLIRTPYRRRKEGTWESSALSSTC